MRFIPVVMSILFVLVAPTGRALQWAAGFEQPGATLIKREHIDRFIEEFELDDDRATIARTLYDGFVNELAAFDRESIQPVRSEWIELVKTASTDLRKVSDEMNAAIKKAFESGATPREATLVPLRFEDAIVEISARPIEGEIKLAKLADEQAVMEAAFLDNLRALLTEDEQKRWPTYRRELDRARFLINNRSYPEVGIDLLAHVEAVELPRDASPNPEVFDAVCREYELAIGARLDELRDWQIDFNRHFHRRQQEMYRAQRQVEVLDDEGKFRGVTAVDPVTVHRLQEFGRQGQVLRKKIRDINREFRPRLLSQLHAEAAAALRDSFNDELHAMYWKPEKSKSFLLVRDLDAKQIVSEEQRSVMQLWLDQLDDDRTRNADEQLALSNEQLDTVAEGPMAPGNLMQNFEAWRRLQREGQELDNACLEKLWTQLTPEQQAQVEKPEPWPLPPN